jgi:thioredoxin-dependent peroxiredoxin
VITRFPTKQWHSLTTGKSSVRTACTPSFLTSPTLFGCFLIYDCVSILNLIYLLGVNMSNTVTLKGTSVDIAGNLPAIGSTAPSFTLVDAALQDVTLDTYAGKRKVLNLFPSVDTPTCASSVREFNQRASSLDNTVVINVSADLPFAQKRFCAAEGIENVVNLSTMRGRDFLMNYGALIFSSKLAGLAARAVIVLDENNIVKYVELVAEITQEPNYDAAVAALS